MHTIYLEPSLLRGKPNLKISVEDTVLGTGFFEALSLAQALLGEELFSGLVCSVLS